MYGLLTAEMSLYAGKSKIVRYEIPCDFMGIAVHTKSKDTPTDI